MDNENYILTINNKAFDTTNLSIVDIVNNIDKYEIKSIKIDELIIQIGNVNYQYTDMTNPISFSGNDFFAKNTLHINKQYYYEHKPELDGLINLILGASKKNIKLESVDIINDNVLTTVLNNKNLEEIYLGSRNNPFKLTKEIYEKFKGKHIKKIHTADVEEDLKVIFDPIISYNYKPNQIGYNSLYKLQTLDRLHISGFLSDEELLSLKYIKDGINIEFFDVEENIIKVVEKLDEYSKHCNIKINCLNDNKNKLNNYLFNNLDKLRKQNITINIALEEMSLDNYINYEQRLYDMVKPAMHLSPFERYLFAYNVVKKFKKYKENKDDKDASRNLYKILNNEYMVCVGYSKMLGDLLYKLGIENTYYDLEVDITFDNVPLDTHIVTEEMLKDYDYGGHARRKVHLIDEKYGIDGIFLTDPTWDNDMENDAYNHALMTQSEYIGMKRYSYAKWQSFTVDETFFSENIEEFYNKTNIWMNKQKDKKNIEADFIYMISSDINKLDKSFYTELCRNYPKVVSSLSEYTKEEIQGIMYILGNYIVSKVNNPIKGEQLRDAVEVIYRNCYGITNEEELTKKIEETMKYNSERHKQVFPTRHKQDKEGNEIIYVDVENKFDISNNSFIR